MVPWCEEKLRGLDPGAGSRTLYPSILTVDIRPENHPAHVGSADDLRFLPDDHFDWVFSSHLIEHLPDPKRAMREWLRVVKPGGHVCTIVPNTLHTMGFNSDPTPHLHEWTPREFLLELCGRGDASVQWYDMRPPFEGHETVYFGEALPNWSFAWVVRKG